MSDSTKKSSVDFTEGVAMAALCSCAATNRVLLDKGIITSDEYKNALDSYSEKMQKNVFSEDDATSFLAAISLLKAFTHE